MDLAGVEFNTDIRQRMHTGKRLGHIRQPDHRFGCLRAAGFGEGLSGF